MLTCTESQATIRGTGFAACRDNDGGRHSPLSEDVIKNIPEKDRTKVRRSYKTGGVNICQARVVGENGDTHLEFDEEADFLFSVPPSAMKKLLPETWKEFPHRPEHK